MSVLSDVKAILGITDTESDETLSVYLNMAEKELLVWCFGKDNGLQTLPTWLEPIQVMAVVTAYNQAGAEGEVHENVDGVAHTFKHDTMISYIHENAPGYARVVR